MVAEADVGVGRGQAGRVRGRRVDGVHQLRRQPRVAADADAAAQERAAQGQLAGQDAVENRSGNVHVEKAARRGEGGVVEGQSQCAGVVELEDVDADAAVHAGQVAVEPAQQAENGLERKAGPGLLLRRRGTVRALLYRPQRVRLQGQPIPALHDQVQAGNVVSTAAGDEGAQAELDPHLPLQLGLVQQREPDRKAAGQQAGGQLQ